MKYLVMIPVKVEFKIVEIEMPNCSEEMAWTIGTEAVQANRQLGTFSVDFVGVTGGRKKIAQSLLRIGSVNEGEEMWRANEWAASMKRDWNF